MNVDFLRNIPLFATLSDEELALIAERLQAEQRVKSERLFRVGETSDTMYLLGRGFVNLTTESGLTLATLGAGSTLGEADLFRNARRTLNAVAAADLEVWSLSNTVLRQMLQAYPLIGAKLSSNFGEQLVQMEGYLVDRMADVPALGDLPRAALVELAQRMHPEHLPAGEILFRANRTLIRRAVEGLYCALTYAVFDFQTNEARIANSGLPYPIHFKASQKKAAPIVLPGVPLGLFDNIHYDEAAIPLESGDVFVFHSDGVTEAWNGKEEFGSARLSALVAKHAHKSARELGREIEKTLRNWAKQHLANDDVTLVIVRVV